MTRKRWLLIGMVALLFVMMCSVAVAASSPTIERYVMGSSGPPVTQGDIILHGTVGEPIAGAFVAGSDRKVGSGFWQQIPEDFRTFLPSLLGND